MTSWPGMVRSVGGVTETWVVHRPSFHCRTGRLLTADGSSWKMHHVSADRGPRGSLWSDKCRIFLLLKKVIHVKQLFVYFDRSSVSKSCVSLVVLWKDCSSRGDIHTDLCPAVNLCSANLYLLTITGQEFSQSVTLLIYWQIYHLVFLNNTHCLILDHMTKTRQSRKLLSGSESEGIWVGSEFEKGGAVEQTVE